MKSGANEAPSFWSMRGGRGELPVEQLMLKAAVGFEEPLNSQAQVWLFALALGREGE